MDNTKELTGFRKYCAEQNISFTAQRIFIDGLGGMAHGLFASLLIGTIFNTVGVYLFDLNYTLWGVDFALLVDAKTFAYAVQGAAMGGAIAYSMKAPPYVLYSCLAVGYAANSLGGTGGPLAVFVVTLIAVFLGKLVSRRTPVDLIVTPTVTILSGVLAASLIAPPIGAAASWLGDVIMWATNQQPFLMGILVSAIIGVILTLPISSAAICAALHLVGLAGGAAVAGCCAHMVGFAAASYRENGVAGLTSQGLGTSMLQVPNLLRKPVLWVPPVVASIVNGPIATCVFGIKMNGAAISSGMGTCGLVGPIGVITGWLSPSEDTLCPRVYEFTDGWELAGGGLARIHAAAAAGGWDTIVCPSPEDLNRIEHLLIPGLGLAFVTSRPGMDYGKKPYRRIRLDAMTEIEGKTRLRFQTRMAALLREEGVTALKDAKANHDRLEAVYNPYVDFDGVRELAAIETGRLLSYLG